MKVLEQGQPLCLIGKLPCTKSLSKSLSESLLIENSKRRSSVFVLKIFVAAVPSLVLKPATARSNNKSCEKGNILCLLKFYKEL